MPIWLAQVVKWSLEILIPMVIGWGVKFYQRAKELAKLKRQAEEATVKAEQYESNPTDDNLNKLP